MDGARREGPHWGVKGKRGGSACARCVCCCVCCLLLHSPAAPPGATRSANRTRVRQIRARSTGRPSRWECRLELRALGERLARGPPDLSLAEKAGPRRKKGHGAVCNRRADESRPRLCGRAGHAAIPPPVSKPPETIPSFSLAPKRTRPQPADPCL